jgi:hypothetical protein
MLLRWRNRPKFNDAMAGERSFAGHEETFALSLALTFNRPLHCAKWIFDSSAP